MPEPTVIHEFEMGHRGFVRVSVLQLRGENWLDVRLWVEPRSQPGADLIPTRKGISVPATYVGELLESLQAVALAVKR